MTHLYPIDDKPLDLKGIQIDDGTMYSTVHWVNGVCVVEGCQECNEVKP